MQTEKSVMQRGRSLLLALSFVLLAVFTAGCFKGEANLTIRADGSSALKTTLLGADILTDSIVEAANTLLKKDPAATVKEISEGDKKGFEVTSEFPDMKALAEKGGDLFTRRDGEAAGIRQKTTWFYDAYAFDLYAGPGEKENRGEGASDPEMEAMMKGFLDQIRYEFSLTLPGAPTKHNADSADEGGKTLRWDLSPTLVSGGEKHIQAEFRLWNKAHIALTAALGILFFSLTVVFFILRQTSEPEKRGMKQGIAIACAVLTLAVCAFSAWQLLSAPTFTAEDSISPAYMANK